MQVELRGESFDPWQELQLFEKGHPHLTGKYGATSVFVGTMRDFNEGADVEAMTLEHYPAMTQNYLEKISQEAMQQWDILDTLIIHRFGDIQPNDPIVLVVAWSAHRAESFAACRYLIEELKSRAPFWKKEFLEDSVRWVTKNTTT